MSTILTLATILLYLAGSLLLLRRLLRGADAGQQSKLPPLFIGLVGTALHAVLIAGTLFVSDGLNIEFFNVVSLIAWMITLLVLIAALGQPVENIGVVVLPLAALCVLLQAVWPPHPNILSHIATEMQAHILISVLAYSLLSLAAVQSILLYVQDRHLRNRHPGGFIRALPPLETMESLLFQMIGLGFSLLSLSLLTGLLYLDNMFAQHLVHKTLLSITAWVVFAVLLWGRWRFGWRGRLAIQWTLAGFVTLMLAYLGSKLVVELILHR